jgi:uncharacterized protein (TIGR03663 family)
MTLQHDPSVTKKINSFLITSLALIIVGGGLILLGASLESPLYDRWGATGATVALFIGVAGAIVFLAGPILTIVRYTWLVKISHSLVDDRSIEIAPLTKYVTIASFSIGYFLGTIFTYIPIRDLMFSNFRAYSPSIWLLLIPATLLAFHAEIIRRTILSAIQLQNKPAPAPEEQSAAQPGSSKLLSVETPPAETIRPIREKKALPQMDSFQEPKHRWLDRPIHPLLPAITNEVMIFALVILMAIATRFFQLEPRVMSHDESLHTYFSYLLYKGSGYEHTPMMHGPFQFHILALTYYLFGVSDFTARIPAVLFSIATVWMVWYWRRYLGRAGALIAGFLLVISPYMLYYGRYVRNESFVGLSGIVMLYVMLRYLESGEKKHLYMLSAALLLHFTTKETAFIYAAQALLYLAVYFIVRVLRQPWQGREDRYTAFILSLIVAILLFTGAFVGIAINKSGGEVISATETAAPANPIEGASPLAEPTGGFSFPTLLIVIGLIALGFAAYYLISGYTWEGLRAERSFDLLIVTGTIVLPSLTAFAIKGVEKIWVALGGIWTTVIPTDAASVTNLTGNDIVIIASIAVVIFLISIIIGYLWNREIWWKIALIFWGPFFILYTTFFTNSAGIATGLIGSLGYWLVQQEVERGSQPWYFYLLIQIPVYEFLPAIGLVVAVILGLRRKIRRLAKPVEATEGILRTEPLEVQEEAIAEEPLTPEESQFGDTFSLLLWWSVSSIAAFTYAGERMPWLTYHMAWPMILLTGWGLGHIVDALDWDELRRRRIWVVLSLVVVFASSLTMSALAVLSPTPPFSGKDLANLEATGNFLLPFIALIASGVGLMALLRGWSFKQIFRTFTLTVFALLAVLTMRASFRASYITYDQATEYLVYAHGATGVKEVIAQAKEISERTTGGMSIALAYDASAPDTGVSWPFVWYLRDFTNQRSFDEPTRSLRDSVFVVVDQKNFDTIDAALGPNYYRFDYIRMWWPNQDYFGLTYERTDANAEFYEGYPCKGALGFLKLFKNTDYSRFCNAVLDPNIRAGIWDIWFNRDYTRYGAAIGSNSTELATWSPADQMRMYIRKDVAAQIWNYGVAPVQTALEEDPYVKNTITLAADLIVGEEALGTTLNAPRSIAFAPNGTFYVADSRNHRILHLDAEGKLLGSWGSVSPGCPYSTANPPPDVPLDTFCEPWGVAVGPTGSVYVTDTWNDRIIKFNADGKYLTSWGYYGQGETPEAFWGPRGIAVDGRGQVYIADTGNKRIAVFDANGKAITQFGMAGFEPGGFDEPVGVAVAADGTVYVTDTWNQRVQGFTPTVDGLDFVPTLQWDIFGWIGQSLENKPLIAINAAGHIFVTDPEAFRILEFDSAGKFIRTWGEFGFEPTQIGLAAGVAVDAQGRVWVTDAGNQRIMRFTLP